MPKKENDSSGDVSEAAARLKAWRFGVRKNRFENGVAGDFSCNLYRLSKKVFVRLEEPQRAHFRELRRTIAASEPVETVAVVNLQLFSLLEDSRLSAASTDLGSNTEGPSTPVEL